MSNIGFATLSVIPSFQGLQGRLSAGVAAPMAAAGRDGGRRFGDAAGREAGSRFRSGWADRMKGFAPLAGLAVGAGAVSFFTDAIEGASDLSESGNKINAIFGEAQTEVQDFASTAGDSLGQTRLQALDAASTFGTFGKAAGLAGSDLAGFSTELVALSTDMASFYNTSVEDAIGAIGSGLRGEAEPLRQFGVLLDDATLRTEAMRQGLIETTKQALTPQQKVLAAHAVILQQTADAQGDFERTSDGLANQQRILTAQWEEMKTAVGSELLPVMTSFVGFLNDDALPALGEAGGLVKDAAAAFGDLPAPVKATAAAFVALRLASAFGVTSAIGSGVASMRSGMDSLRIRTMMAADAFRAARAGQLEFVGNSGRFVAPVGRMSAALQGLGAAATGAGGALRRGLSGAIGLVGGPWGAALIGGTAILGKFWAEHQEAKARVESLTASLDAQTGAITDNTREQLFNTLQTEGGVAAAKTLGISLTTLRRGLEGNAELMARVNAVVDEHNSKIHQTSESLPGVSQKMVDQSAAAATLADAIEVVSGDVAAMGADSQSLSEFMGRSTDVTNEAADATNDYGDALKTARDRLQDLIDKEQERADNAVKRRRDELGLIQALQDTRKELSEGKRTLDLNTLAGQANREALYDLADQWNQSSEAVRSKKGAWREMRRDFVELATAMGGGTDSAEARAKRLANTLLTMPKPKIDTTAIDKAKEKVRELQALIDGLEQGRKVNLGVPLAPGAPSARLNGGPVSAGVPYIVGERRPEVFVPDRPGRIEKDASRFAGGGVTINIDKVIANSGGSFMDDMRSRAQSAVGGGRRVR